MITPRKLSEVLPPEMAEFAALKLDAYLDKPLIIFSCREVNGQRGSYMRMVVSLPDQTEKFHLATGAAQPMEILSYLNKNMLFPIEGTFMRSGNAIVLKG